MVDLNPPVKASTSRSSIQLLNKVTIWIRAIRAPFFTASIIPLVIGMAIAWYEFSTFDLFLGFLTLLAGVAIHAGTNLANDYFDRDTDDINEYFTQFNGGSRMIQNEIIPPKYILFASIISYVIGALAALTIVIVTNGILLVAFLIIAIGLGFFYTAIPVRFSYRGLGEIAVFVGFGPLGVLSAYYIQLGHLNSMIPLLASIPIAFLIAMVLFLNEFQDKDADEKAGKKTIVVALGKEKSLKIFIIGIIMAYFSQLIIVILFQLPLMLLLPFISLPLVFKIMKIATQNYNAIHELLPANGMTIALHFSYGLLMVVSFLLA
ncbi:MAG: 1,4-dihydroxy-2-naphthoate octaprenyltransferase [Candidatus Hodarchaeales archaeon]